MPTPSERSSLNTDLETRYGNQRVGSAFDVKDRLKYPNNRAPIGGNEALYTLKDFAVRKTIGLTELLDALDANTTSSPSSKELSLFMRGFTNKKYKP